MFPSQKIGSLHPRLCEHWGQHFCEPPILSPINLIKPEDNLLLGSKNIGYFKVVYNALLKSILIKCRKITRSSVGDCKYK